MFRVTRTLAASAAFSLTVLATTGSACAMIAVAALALTVMFVVTICASRRPTLARG